MSINSNNNKRFVAMLDILGFKDLVNNNEHSRLTKVFRRLGSQIRISLETNNINYKGTSIFPDNTKYHLDIKSLIISDTVILWTGGNSINDILDLLQVVNILLPKTFKEGFPLRGAITYGEFDALDFDKPVANNKKIVVAHTVFGKAMIEAYELEQKQDWAGCIIAESVINKIMSLTNKLDSNYKKLAEAFSIDYKVPMKSGEINEYRVINWLKTTLNSPNEIARKDVKGSFSKYNKKIDSWDVKRKIDNTLKFYDTVKRKMKKENCQDKPK